MDALFKCTETVVENELVTLSDTQSGFMSSVSITVVLSISRCTMLLPRWVVHMSNSQKSGGYLRKAFISNKIQLEIGAIKIIPHGAMTESEIEGNVIRTIASKLTNLSIYI